MVAAKSNQNLLLSDFILTSPAPIETACWLAHSFRNMATREMVRSRDLEAAGEHCQAIGVDLMALAGDLHEKCSRDVLRSVDARGVTILDLLIECEQKRVSNAISSQLVYFFIAEPT
jgi:hypothetical protein